VVKGKLIMNMSISCYTEVLDVICTIQRMLEEKTGMDDAEKRDLEQKLSDLAYTFHSEVTANA